MCTQDGSTPLHLACMGGHMDLAVMLIEKYGANPIAVAEVRIRCNDVWMRMKMYNKNTICHVFFPSITCMGCNIIIE